MTFLKNILTFLLLVLFYGGFAQHYGVQHLSLKTGLPSNSIRTVFKDNKNIIWIGTDGGLCKYKGDNIEIYTTKDNLSGNKIWTITEDKDSVLWFGSYDNGISYLKDTKFKKLQISDTVSKNIRCAAYQPSINCLMFGTDNGFIVKNKDKWHYFNDKNTITNNRRLQVLSIMPTDSLIYVFTYGLHPYIYNPLNNTLKPDSSFVHRNIGSACNGIIKNNLDTVYCINRNEIKILNKKLKNEFNNTGQVFDICKGEDNDIWFAGWDISLKGNTGGLLKLENDTLINYTKKLNIKSKAVWTVFYDSIEKMLWAGTLDNGLYLFYNKDFEYLDILKKSIKINDIVIYKGETWIASDDYLFQVKNNCIKRTFDKSYFFSKWKKNPIENLKPFYFSKTARLKIKDIGFDKDSCLYISGTGGFFKYNQNTNEFNMLGEINNPFVFYNNGIYTVGWSNLSKYNLSLKSKTEYNYHTQNTPVDIHKIVKHKNKVWYLSWAKGLYYQNGNNFSRLNLIYSYLDSHIKDICFDSNDNIYIAQNNGEILKTKYNKDTLILLDKISANTGLFGNIINWINCDANNNLLIGTNMGLNVLSHSTGKIILFNEKEGYSAFESNISLTQNNSVIVNTETGLLTINPLKLNQKRLFYRTHIWLSDLEGNKYNKNILDYYQNNITISFNRINYLNADKDYYSYRIPQLNNSWSEYSENKKVLFYNLKPGNYIFELRIKNVNSINSPIIKKMLFTIKPAWYQTALFYISLIIVFIITTWLGVTIYVNKVKQKEAEKHRINQKITHLRIQALQSQMNPHFIFNSISSIQNLVLENNIDETLMYLSNFAKMLRNTLNYASLETISIKQEIDFLNNYISLEKLRFGDNFKFLILIGDNIDADETNIPPLLFQPIIENAIKHGRVYELKNGEINVEIKKEAKYLRCSVKDNGIGIENASKNKTHQNKSKGLNIIEERLKLLNENKNFNFKIKSTSSGTEIIFYTIFK